MISIKKSHKGSYEVNYQKPIELYKSRHGDNLRKEIEHLFNEERKIIVYLDSVVDFSKNGYKSLYELIQLSKQENCIINFIYFGVDITHRIELLSDES